MSVLKELVDLNLSMAVPNLSYRSVGSARLNWSNLRGVLAGLKLYDTDLKRMKKSQRVALISHKVLRGQLYQADADSQPRRRKGKERPMIGSRYR